MLLRGFIIRTPANPFGKALANRLPLGGWNGQTFAPLHYLDHMPLDPEGTQQMLPNPLRLLCRRGLYNNRLTGPLPAEWAALTNLQWL